MENSDRQAKEQIDGKWFWMAAQTTWLCASKKYRMKVGVFGCVICDVRDFIWIKLLFSVSISKINVFVYRSAAPHRVLQIVSAYIFAVVRVTWIVMLPMCRLSAHIVCSWHFVRHIYDLERKELRCFFAVCIDRFYRNKYNQST